MADALNPEQIESREAVPGRPETAAEAAEQNFIRGAEMLEEPQNGSFVSTLQSFIAWVKHLTG